MIKAHIKSCQIKKSYSQKLKKDWFWGIQFNLPRKGPNLDLHLFFYVWEVQIWTSQAFLHIIWATKSAIFNFSLWYNIIKEGKLPGKEEGYYRITKSAAKDVGASLAAEIQNALPHTFYESYRYSTTFRRIYKAEKEKSL